MYSDLISIEKPQISVLTPSLNHGRFLASTIESILKQTYRNFEHIVIDGGSTDNSIEILKQYSHIRWISEKDDSIVQAYRKGLKMARGEYIFQCCISDGYLDKNWFKKCVEILDSDEDISLVWGLPQTMTEDGNLYKISYAYFLDDPPPQKTNFLTFWLSTGFWYPEGNYCVRREIYDICYPKDDPSDPFLYNDCMGFVYNFNTLGYIPYFLPIIANYGRIHHDNRGKRLYDIEIPLFRKYLKDLKLYRKQLLQGKIRHYFRNGRSEIIKEVNSKEELSRIRKQVWRYRITQSRLMRYDLYTVQKKIRQKIRERFIEPAK
ncbi:glycosyltransferase [Candidatus Parcubacteria bacterium]|jgi:glycosyltransferase involved in cell wall biosynthesis|nr:MAG: glycosyltransferase [Candidatus Parcubacteria bacterium]